MPDANIEYVPHKAIDKTAWNACVDQASNGLIYARTEFLDAITHQWDGIVYGDYEAVFPVPLKRKFGIKYAYQPWGMAQGGVFGQNVNEMLEKAFLEKLTDTVRYGTLDLNESSSLTHHSSSQFTIRDNYLLNLRRPYEAIEQGFNEDGKKNLRRAARHRQVFVENAKPSTVMKFYRSQYGTRNPNLGVIDYNRMEMLMEMLLKKEMGYCCSVESEGIQNAAAFFGNYNGRLYYLLGAPNELGRDKKSMHFLLDQVIRRFANKMDWLDFEGSDIPSVAAFYKKFGPENHPYPSIHFNNLPLALKLLKK